MIVQVDPRRPALNTPAHLREPGIPPYLPELPLPHESILNYNQVRLFEINDQTFLTLLSDCGGGERCHSIALWLGVNRPCVCPRTRPVRHQDRAEQGLRLDQGRLRALYDRRGAGLLGRRQLWHQEARSEEDAQSSLEVRWLMGTRVS